jgi:leucyl aminopeptidase
MPPLPDIPHVNATVFTGPVSECAADFLIVPVFEDDDLSDLADVEAASGGDVSRGFASRELSAKLFDLYATRLDSRTPRALCIGAGPREKLTADRVRKLATAAGWAVRRRGGGRAAWLVRTSVLGAAGQARAATDGLVLAALGSDRHKTTLPQAVPLVEALVVVRSDGDLRGAVARGEVDGRYTNLARWLSDEPGNRLTPVVLADTAQRLLQGTGVEVDVLDESRLAALGMGLLLGVARGSAEPPRLIVMRYTPPGGTTDGRLGLVGKGITFDTGGISIKVADKMDRMKHDMSGGAAVIAAMRAIAELGAPISVLGVVPATENMPGGRAYKPGDILQGASGKTVEIINTDAEGRLILGDALWYARRLGATHLVDVATLTGACVIALGKVCSGLFGSPETWVEAVRKTGARLGERFWPLPSDEEYGDLLESQHADIANSGARAGGAIAGAMFLREFTGPVPWAHLDVAGTAWADEAKAWQPKGATGVTTRTLIELATTADSWPE